MTVQCRLTPIYSSHTNNPENRNASYEQMSNSNEKEINKL